MGCERYDDLESGRIGPADFERHLKECEKCRMSARLDDRLAHEIESLKRPVLAPLLWNRIEAGLRKEQKAAVSRTAQPRTHRFFDLGRLWLAPAAALLLVVLGVIFGVRIAAPGSDLLAERALRRIEVRERQYIQAIEDLENKARPILASLDLNLQSLYRTKLDTIEAQIERCREALDTNPGNAHIRRYLLGALQDKRQTLAEVIGHAN